MLDFSKNYLINEYIDKRGIHVGYAKQALSKKGVSLADVARKAGVSRSYISQMFQAKKPVTDKVVNAMAVLLGCEKIHILVNYCTPNSWLFI